MWFLVSKAAPPFAIEALYATTIIYGYYNKPDRHWPLNRYFPSNELHIHGSADAVYKLSATGLQSSPDFVAQWAVSGCSFPSSTMISLPPFGICREKHNLGYTSDTAVSCTHLKVHNNNCKKKCFQTTDQAFHQLASPKILSVLLCRYPKTGHSYPYYSLCFLLVWYM